MTSLLELQRAFARAIVAGDDAVAGLVVSDSFTGAERINIYRNNHLESIVTALGDVYPVVSRLVGEDFFRYCTRCYLHEHPLRQGSLIDFGGALATFLSRFEPAAALPYLRDVARLEWAWHEVFHAARSRPLDPRRLAELDGDDGEELRFRLSSACRWLRSPYPVLRIWEVNQPEHAEVEVVSLEAGPDDLLVLRTALQVEIIGLEPGEHAFLDALATGAGLGRACETASEADASFDPGRAMSRHVRMGTIVDLVRRYPVGETVLQ